MPQPAWDETQSVDLTPCDPGVPSRRSPYRMSTDSTSVPSWSFHSVLTVAPLSQETSRTYVSSGGNNAPLIGSRCAAGRSVHVSGSTLRPV